MADLHAPIESDRLTLVLLPPAVLRAAAAAQAAGDDDTAAVTEDLAWPEVAPVPAELVASLPAARRLAQLDEDPATAPWLVRALVVEDPTAPGGRRIVGHLGGHGPPDDRRSVEVGFTVSADDRGRGLATEAARAWFAWAHRHGAAVARTSTTADNVASLAVAARLGLAAVDPVWDEDDQVWELVHEGPLPLR